MPVGKRIRSDPDIQSRAKRSKRSTSSTTEKKLSQLNKIGYKADKWHSMYRYLPDCTVEVKKIIYKEIGSFLNGLGGILCFGCRSNGCIYGIDISRKEEDNIRLLIDDAFKKFHPFVLPSIYREVACSGSGRSSCRKIVIEIKISTTNGLNMYEDEFHEVFIREKESYKGPLTPHEIKKFVTDMYNKRCSVGSVGIPKASSNLPTPIKSKGSKPVASVHPLQVCHKASMSGSTDASKDQVKQKSQPTTKGEQSTSDKNMGEEKKVVCVKGDTATAVSKDMDKDVKQDNDSKKQQVNTKIKGFMRKVASIVRPKSSSGSRKTDSKSVPETGTSTKSTDSNTTTTTSSSSACASRSKPHSNTASSTKSHSVIDLTNIENEPVTKPSHTVVSNVSSATVSSTQPRPLHNSNKPNTQCNSILVPPSYYSSKPPPAPPLHPASYYSAVPPNSTTWTPPISYPYQQQQHQYYQYPSDYRPHPYPSSYAPPPPSHLYPYFTGYTN